MNSKQGNLFLSCAISDMAIRTPDLTTKQWEVEEQEGIRKEAKV